MQDGQPTPAHPNPVIRSQRVYLRPAERSDLSLFVRWFADADTTRHLASRAPFSQAMEEKWFERVVEGQGKDHYHFVICLVADGTPIGTADLRDINLEDGRAEFGISIGEKPEWNKGYGTEALSAICDFGFGRLRLERISLEVYEGNARARRSYEKAGFRVEGTLRNAHFSEGRHSDVIVMSLLRDEWLALNRPTSWQISLGEA
ncbi:MAG TPA: GNAT family protein [Candidatus Limnocylindria bacterium]|nr:GNAT family protein [Candidatus Limnocylindria bacterium]